MDSIRESKLYSTSSTLESSSVFGVAASSATLPGF